MTVMSQRFLDGVRVLDLTTFLSGPFATQLLADMGAEVIKVEAPAGDSSRTIPPHFIGTESAYFHAVNRSKKSIQVNLKDDRGKQLFTDLSGVCDVVVENFRPGVMDRMGLPLDELRATHPRLITCSISGFGADSPHRDVPAYDAMIQAWTGGMSLTGHPGSPPSRMGIPIGDLGAGMYAALGVTGAVARRERTGQGDHIDVAMYDAQIALLGYQAAYYLHSGEVPGPQGTGHVSIPTYRAFRCSDGAYVMVTANTEAMWRSMCEVLQVTDLLEDPRFSTNADRLANAEALWQRLEPAFESVPSQQLAHDLAKAGVPAAPVNDVAQALSDEQVQARNMVVHLSGPGGAAVDVPGNPLKSSGARPDDEHGFPPALGQDTADVLQRVAGLDASRIDELQDARVVGPFPR